jgi:4-amino-4-deoxy-L-arabinose transferase-like glycosyltransferase
MNIKNINPLYWVLGFSVLVSGWPFIGYRFTDGDISHWISIASEIRKNFTFLTSSHDQFHGPFLAWFTAIFTLIKLNAFYLYNLTNALCFVMIVWLSYFFSEKLFDSKKLALFNSVITATGLMLVYLSRTPMYDLPAAAFYFSFTGFYYLGLKNKKDSYFWLAMASIGIAALSRFSISLGIAGVYMIGVNFIFKKSLADFLKKIVSDGAIIILSGIIFNLPWIAGQIHAHGLTFLNGFYDDNVGRYLIEKTAHPKLNREYWAFPLYALIGMLPYTFLLLASIFKKGLWKEIKKDDIQKIMLLAFIPGLLLFSFSGHVKLGH